MTDPKEFGHSEDSATRMKQACIDLSNAAIAVFDLIDAGGVTAPMDDIDGIFKLKAIVDLSEELRGYYERRNIQRMLALGVSPAQLLKMAKGSS